MFAEATAPGQIYRASPMSLLYAISPFYRQLQQGLMPDTMAADIRVHQPDSLDDFVRAVADQQPRVVALSATTYGTAFVRAAARSCKRLDPETQVIVGGSHFDGIYDHYLGDPAPLDPLVDRNIDVVISGQAEWTLSAVLRLAAAEPRLPLAELITRNRQALAGSGGASAVWWREGRSLKILNAGVNAAHPTTTALLPPRELLAAGCEHHFSIFRDSRGRRLRTAQVLTYRGCLFAASPKNACTFCFVANRYTKPDVGHTVAELRALSEAGYRALFFDDAIFTSRSQARKAVLREIAAALRQLKFEIVGFQTRADYIDREVLQILSEVDCKWYCSLGSSRLIRTYLRSSERSSRSNRFRTP